MFFHVYLYCGDIMSDLENKINAFIKKIRPYIINDGGDIEFVNYENNILYIKMLGNCTSCHLIDFTVKEGIETMIKEEIPEITEVINIDQ